MAKKKPAVMIAGLAFTVMAAGFAYNVLSGGPKIWGPVADSDKYLRQIVRQSRSAPIPYQLDVPSGTWQPNIPSIVHISGHQIALEEASNSKQSLQTPYLAMYFDTTIAVLPGQICLGSGQSKNLALKTDTIELAIVYCENDSATLYGYGKSKLDQVTELVPAILGHMFSGPFSQNRK